MGKRKIETLSPEKQTKLREQQRNWKSKQRARDAADPARKTRKLDTLYMFGCVDISVIIADDGEIWFKGVDIARALEMEDPNTAIFRYVDEEYTKSYENLTSTPRRYPDIHNIHPKTTFVNETGMNMFLIHSRMPKAGPFVKWLCSEVLPSIRKTGKYAITDPNNNPYKELNEYLKKQVEELKLEINHLKSDVRNKDAHLDRKDAIIQRNMTMLFSMRPTCIAPLEDRSKDEYVVIYRKFDSATADSIEDIELLYLPYYGCRIQSSLLRTKESELKKLYPGLQLLIKFKLPNSVNFYNFIFEQMSEILERGKGELIQSFRIKNSSVSETNMVHMIKNLYRNQYGESSSSPP